MPLLPYLGPWCCELGERQRLSTCCAACQAFNADWAATVQPVPSAQLILANAGFVAFQNGRLIRREEIYIGGGT